MTDRVGINEKPLGDARIQITYMGDHDGGTALFTCRIKDQDLTEAQLRELSRSATLVADHMRKPTGYEA